MTRLPVLSGALDNLTAASAVGAASAANITTPVGRAVAGLVVAGAIAATARRARALSTGGAVAAVAVGTATLAAGWSWGALLIGFFVTSTALSRFRADRKERRTAAVVAKGSERDAVQVLANGALFAATGSRSKHRSATLTS